MIAAMLRLRFIAAPILTTLLLAGCGLLNGDSSPVDYKPLSFTQYQPIYMAVSSIEIVEEYKPPMRPPYVEHLIPYSPSEAIRIWVRDRLRVGGSNRTMQVIIRDGSVMATSLAKQGAAGWLSFNDNKRYDAKLEVEMRIYEKGVISEASIFVTATRSMTLPDSAGTGSRNTAFRRMMNDMMESFNAEMEKNMFMYMANYISYSQSP